MMDILDDLDIHDARILQAHYERGFAYLTDITREFSLEDEDIRSAACRLFERMDAELVRGDNELPSYSKTLFCELRGLPQPRKARARELRRLLGLGLYGLRNNGVGFTLSQTLRFFRK